MTEDTVEVTVNIENGFNLSCLSDLSGHKNDELLKSVSKEQKKLEQKTDYSHQNDALLQADDVSECSRTIETLFTDETRFLCHFVDMSLNEIVDRCQKLPGECQEKVDVVL